MKLKYFFLWKCTVSKAENSNQHEEEKYISCPSDEQTPAVWTYSTCCARQKLCPYLILFVSKRFVFDFLSFVDNIFQMMIAFMRDIITVLLHIGFFSCINVKCFCFFISDCNMISFNTSWFLSICSPVVHLIWLIHMLLISLKVFDCVIFWHPLIQ